MLYRDFQRVPKVGTFWASGVCVWDFCKVLSAVAFLQKAYIPLGPNMGSNYPQRVCQYTVRVLAVGLAEGPERETLRPFRLPQPCPCPQVSQTS